MWAQVADLLSLPLDGATYSRAACGLWGIENKLHWVPDVWFQEDQNRDRTGNAVAPNLLKQKRTKQRGIKGKQLNAGGDHA